MLGIFAVADRYVAERDPSGRVTAVLASPLRDFVIAYLTASEGRLGTDAATARLLGALDAATVRVLGAEEIDHISVSVLTGDATHAPTGAPGTAATPAASTP